MRPFHAIQNQTAEWQREEDQTETFVCAEPIIYANLTDLGNHNKHGAPVISFVWL